MSRWGERTEGGAHPTSGSFFRTDLRAAARMSDTSGVTETPTKEPAAMNVTTRKVEALQFQHEIGDTKPATRIEVLVDGVLIGYVTSNSSESRTPGNGRTLGRLRGYSRRFFGHLDTNRMKSMPSMRNADAINSSRKHAITELVEAWKRAN